MRVAHVVRDHQALVPSRGQAKPAASPTSHLLGSRKAKDGLTWAEHYKKALAKLGQVHQDPELRPLLEQISADPKQVDRWMANPQEAAQALYTYSQQHNAPAGMDIARSLVQDGPGNTVATVPSVASSVFNATGAALMPWHARGPLQVAARWAPDIGALATAQPVQEMRHEDIPRLGQLFHLQLQRDQAPAGSPQAAALDQQLAQTQATPFTGDTSRMGDSARQLLGDATGQLFTSGGAAALGKYFPVPALIHDRQALLDPERRTQALGDVAGAAGGAIAARGATVNDLARGAGQTVRDVVNLPQNAKNLAVKGTDWVKSKLPGAVPTAEAAPIEAGAKAVGEAGSLLGRGARWVGTVGRALGATARAVPAVSTIIQGGHELGNLPHALSPEGQAELEQQMAARAPALDRQGALGRLGTATADAARGMLLGDMGPAKADFALGLTDVTGTTPQAVQDARQAVVDRQQQEQGHNELANGYQQMYPLFGASERNALAEAAYDRSRGAEQGTAPLTPVADERWADQLHGVARQNGWLAKDFTPGEMGRFKELARTAGPTATLNTFFPQHGPLETDRSANNQALAALSHSATQPAVMGPEFEYFNRPIHRTLEHGVAPAVPAAIPAPASTPAPDYGVGDYFKGFAQNPLADAEGKGGWDAAHWGGAAAGAVGAGLLLHHLYSKRKPVHTEYTSAEPAP